MRFTNLTPHPITLVGEDGDVLETFSPSDPPARAEQTDRKVGELPLPGGGAVEVVETTFGPPGGLPDPEDGTTLIVSLKVAEAARVHGRPTEDLVLPSGVARDGEGNRIGCLRFARLPDAAPEPERAPRA